MKVQVNGKEVVVSKDLKAELEGLGHKVWVGNSSCPINLIVRRIDESGIYVSHDDYKSPPMKRIAKDADGKVVITMEKESLSRLASRPDLVAPDGRLLVEPKILYIGRGWGSSGEPQLLAGFSVEDLGEHPSQSPIIRKHHFEPKRQQRARANGKEVVKFPVLSRPPANLFLSAMERVFDEQPEITVPYPDPDAIGDGYVED